LTNEKSIHWIYGKLYSKTSVPNENKITINDIRAQLRFAPEPTRKHSSQRRISSNSRDETKNDK